MKVAYEHIHDKALFELVDCIIQSNKTTGNYLWMLPTIITLFLDVWKTMEIMLYIKVRKNSKVE
ncbi:MAG TPA: hypothetical protein VIY08_11515 [Candidatus Nitrosocosmicus sp.]